jgi:hypothetical protein
LFLFLCILGLNIPMVWRLGIMVVAALVIALFMGAYPGHTAISDEG